MEAEDFDYARSRARQRVELRSAILDAAADLLAQGGPEHMSVRSIAERVGASTKVIYSHFGGKPGIVEALYRDGFERLAGLVSAAGEGPGTSTDRIGRIAVAYRAFALESPARYELMFGPRVRDLLPEPPQRDPVVAASQVIADALREGQAAGEFTPGDVHAQTKFIWSALHATVSLELMEWFEGAEAEENHRRLVDAALVSLTVRH